MPELFDKCVKNGGKVRTVTGPNKEHGLKKDEYVRYCVLNGKSHRGETKKVKKNSDGSVGRMFGEIVDLMQVEVNQDTSKSTIEFIKTGRWNHPFYGEIVIDKGTLEAFKENFDRGVRKAVPIDIEHKVDEGAVGWVQNFEVIQNGEFNDDYSLMATIEWTDEGRELIKSKKYRFFSPEITDVYQNKKSEETYNNVVLGGGITNRPFFEELSEVVVLSENYKLGKGEETMNLEEAKAKLREDRKFSLPEDASDADKAVLEEAKAELYSEVAEKLEEAETAKEKAEKNFSEAQKLNDQKFAEQNEEAKKVFAELGISNLEEAKALAEDMKKAKFAEIKAEVEKLVLPKSVEKVAKFAESLSEEDRKEYFETLKEQNITAMFNEVGDHGEDEDPGEAPAGVDAESHALDQKARKYMSEHAEEFKGMSEADAYRKAVYTVNSEE